MNDLTVQDLDALVAAGDDVITDEIAKKATLFARMAMQDVDYALRAVGMVMTNEQREEAMRAMMLRKAKNEVRKYNAS